MNCNRDQPINSTCSKQDSGCYAWECDADYTEKNNDCVSNDAPTPAPEEDCEIGEHTSQRACNNDRTKPAHSTCKEQVSGCYAWECDTNYTQYGSVCINCAIDDSASECTEAIDGECGSLPYSPTQLCAKGTLIEVSSSPVQWSCNGLHGGENDTNCNTCPINTYPFLNTCNGDTTGKPANSECYLIPSGETGTGCYKWRCQNGYQLNTTTSQCEQISSTERVDGECPTRPYNPNNLCVQGDPSVSSSPVPEQWDCNGS